MLGESELPQQLLCFQPERELSGYAFGQLPTGLCLPEPGLMGPLSETAGDKAGGVFPTFLGSHLHIFGIGYHSGILLSLTQIFHICAAVK